MCAGSTQLFVLNVESHEISKARGTNECQRGEGKRMRGRRGERERGRDGGGIP